MKKDFPEHFKKEYVIQKNFEEVRNLLYILLYI